MTKGRATLPEPPSVACVASPPSSPITAMVLMPLARVGVGDVRVRSSSEERVK